jgi:hypothetical protein
VDNILSGGKKMLKRSILKAALVIVIALAMIIPVSAIGIKTRTLNVIPSNPVAMNRDVVFEDGFETYDDWLIDFPPWTCIDVNGDITFGHTGFNFPHEGEAYAFIVFNPDTTIPPQTDVELQPHTGDKYVAGFNNDNAGYTNDDWLITPQLTDSYESVIFWAKSYSATYQLERFTVCVSTTDTDPASFTMISPDPYVTVPVAWTEYTYDLSSYSGQSIYIGIHMVSVDSWFLMIDDFQVTKGVGDTTAPVTNCTLEGTLEGDVYTSDVTVTLTATDDGSGVNFTMYKVDSGTLKKYYAPFVVSGSGEHTVAFYSVDIAGNEEVEKSTIFTIQYPIEITIKGGLGVSATIKNTGTTELTNISWTITLDGKLIFFGKTKTDIIPTLAVGDSVTVKDLVIGFGKTGIAVEAGSAAKSATGTVILFLVIGVA